MIILPLLQGLVKLVSEEYEVSELLISIMGNDYG